MSSAAARIQRDDEPMGDAALGSLAKPNPLRCVAVAPTKTEFPGLQLIADQSRLNMQVMMAPDMESARAQVSSRAADVLILGSDQGEEAAKISDDARVAGIPVLVIGDEMEADDVVSALRSGAADYLRMPELTAEMLDQAVESALQRSGGRQADQLAQISNLQAENETLRRIAARNMRLLKGQTLPLMSLAWRMLNGEQINMEDRTRYAKGLGRITRNVSGLIDDTVIVAATHKAQDHEEDVDIGGLIDEILRDDLGEISNSRAHVVTGPMPVLRARRGQMQMLFEELLLTAVRNGRIGRVPEIEFGADPDADGNPVIWMVEKGLQLSARKQALAQRADIFDLQPGGTLQDAHSWSLCQRLVERNDGQFRISEPEKNASRIMMRFPRRMLVRRGEAG